MEKSQWQKDVEERKPCLPYVAKRRITKKSNHSNHKVGEIIKVTRWGTFGCWDEKNRWVDFYCCEEVAKRSKWYVRLFHKLFWIYTRKLV